MLTYFIRNLFIAQISHYSNTLIRQCFLQLFRHLAGIVRLCIGDIEHRHLYRSQPCGQGASVLLDQDTDEALERTHDRAVQHDGTVALAIFSHEFGIEALGQVGVDLNRAALPFAAQRVLQRVLDLGAVEGTFTGQIFELATRSTQTFGQRVLCLVPAFVRTDTFSGRVDRRYRMLVKPKSA